MKTSTCLEIFDLERDKRDKRGKQLWQDAEEFVK